MAAQILPNEGINIPDAFSKTPPELDFIWHGFLAGTVGVLVAPGATSKSFWALQAAAAVACNQADTLALSPKREGAVIYLALEDPRDAIIKRLHALGQKIKAHADQLHDNFSIIPSMGLQVDIMAETFVCELIARCAGVRLLIIDTLSRIHRLDENKNGEMAQVICQLERVAKESGAAILFLHHISKGSAREGASDQQQAARGASALVDNARWCANMLKMTKYEAARYYIPPRDAYHSRQFIAEKLRHYYVRWSITKQNYDLPTDDVWLQRAEGGVLQPVYLQMTEKVKADKKSLKNEGDDYNA